MNHAYNEGSNELASNQLLKPEPSTSAKIYDNLSLNLANREEMPADILRPKQVGTLCFV